MLVGKEGILKTNKGMERMGEFTLPSFCRSKKTIIPSYTEVGTFFKNFLDASQRGLDSVLPDKEPTMPLLAAGLKALERGERVRMIGFTLRRYTDPEKGISGFAFREAVERGVVAQLLQLDPKCAAAKERVRIESPGKNFETTPFFKDGAWVRLSYEDRPNVSFRKYATPYVGAVLLPNMAFVEIYHLGNDGEGANDTICGRVPIMVIRSNTPFYRLFSTHFDTFWNAPTRGNRWKPSQSSSPG